MDLDEIIVDDIFSAGPSVSFHVTLKGKYRGGLGPACEAHLDKDAIMGVSGIARVHEGAVAKVEA